MDKRYEEALERAKAAIKDCGDNLGRKKMIYGIFPELAESEDEMMRKSLIEYLKTKDHECDHWVAWLEKRKEQKPAEWTDADEKILERIINRLKVIIPVPAEDPVRVEFERREDTEAINWLKRRVASRPKQEQEWSDDDEKMLVSILWHVSYSVSNGKQTDCHCDLTDWLKALPERIKSISPHHTIRWRRATEGENLPESIIIPDGEEPRFGKCAVRNSYYIPISELKELPKE